MPPFDPEDNTFLLAGPVKMHPRVLRAMSRPAIAHRDEEFKNLTKEIVRDLRTVFQAPHHKIALLTGSGTAGMEAAASSLLSKQDRALALVNGKFGERFAKLASLYGNATVLSSGWGEPIPLERIEEALRNIRPKALFLTHNESSVGFTWPLNKIARIAHEEGAFVVADCITSVGGLDVKVGEWGVDVAIVGSQKCLGAPAGLSAVAVSPEALQAMDPQRGYYLNLPRWIEKSEIGDSPFTPAIPLHLALSEALKILLSEGLERRFARIRKQAEGTRAALESMGLELFIASPYRSDTVTAVRVPRGVEESALRRLLKEKYGVVIAGGQDEVKGKIFRIGHMGTVSTVEIAGALFALERALIELGFAPKVGAWVEALGSRVV